MVADMFDLANRVVTLNSVAGLISTLINVYSQQGGRYSITAKVTVIATASCTGIMAMLFLLYNNWILEDVKKRHLRELGLDLEKKDDNSMVVEALRRTHRPVLKSGRKT